jgi:hypothetical protein
MLIRQFMVHPYIQHSHKNIAEEAHVFFSTSPLFPVSLHRQVVPLTQREYRQRERQLKYNDSLDLKKIRPMRCMSIR